MAFYPAAVNKRFTQPANAGRVEGDSVSAPSASFICGSFVKIFLRINDQAIAIESARFQTNGCGFAVASADVLCSWLSGKQLTELHGLGDAELAKIISAELGTFPPERRHCDQLVFDALRKAMALYRERRVEEFRGETALICTCFGISEDSIVAAIAANGLTHTEQVADACRAGSGCGSCRMLIQELIDSVEMSHD